MIITWNEGVYTASRIIPIIRYSYGDEIANTGQGMMREFRTILDVFGGK